MTDLVRDLPTRDCNMDTRLSFIDMRTEAFLLGEPPPTLPLLKGSPATGLMLMLSPVGEATREHKAVQFFQQAPRSNNALCRYTT